MNLRLLPIRLLSIAALLLPLTSFAQNRPHSKKRLEVVLETDGKKFRALRKRVVEREDGLTYRRPARDGFLEIESIDAQGKALQTQSVPDPTHVFYDFMDPGQPNRGGLKGGIATAPKAELVVSLPYEEGARRLRISRHRRKKHKDNAAHPPATETELEPQATLELTGVPE